MGRTSFHRTVSCILLLQATYTADVIAGMTAVATDENVCRQDTIVQLHGVHVTEHKRTEQVLSAYYMDSTLMKATQSTRLTEVLSRFPGVSIKDYGGVGGMMTMNIRGMESSHVSVTVDGIPQMETQVGQKDFSKYNLAYAEKVAMGFSATEEDNWQARNLASSANVNINTLDGLRKRLQQQRPNATSLTLEQGSYDTWGVHAMREMSLTSSWVTRLAGRYQYAENNYPFAFYNGNALIHQRRQNSRTNMFQLECTHLADLGRGNEIVGKSSLYNCYRRLPGQIVLYNTFKNNERLHDQEYTLALGWNRGKGRKWETSANARWGLDINRYKDASNIYPQGMKTENYRQCETYVSGKCIYRPSEQWTVNYASDYSYNTLNGNEYSIDHASRTTLTNAFGSSWHNRIVTLSGYMTMTSCYNDTRSGNASDNLHKWSPMFSGSFRPFLNRNLYLKMYYKNTFRPPSFTETYYYHLGSTDLLPERTIQWGAGIAFQEKIASWWPVMSVTCDAYINTIHDKIISVPLNLHVWKTANLGKVKTEGISIGLHNRFRYLVHTFMLTGYYSLQNAEDVSRKTGNTYGYQLPYVPVSNGNITLFYENRQFNACITCKGTSSRWGTMEHAPSTRLPAYAEWDASVGCRIPNIRKITGTCTLQVCNLFNKQYSVINGYPMPGRTYRISITFK